MRNLSLKRSKSLIVTILFVALTTSCSTGTITYSRATKHPEEANGFMRIATNSPVPVTVDGEKSAYAEKDVGGYLIIHEADLAQFVKNTKRLFELDDEIKQLKKQLESVAK